MDKAQVNREAGVTENCVLSNATRDEGNQAKRDLTSKGAVFSIFINTFQAYGMLFFPID